MLPDVVLAREGTFAADLMRERLRPPSQLSVSEWADLHRYLPPTAAEPGRWRTDRTPYLREVMDSFSDPLVEVVVFMKGAQVGGSECLLNVLGYFIDQDPAPILLVQVSDGEAAKFSKERVAPMIRDTPVLAEKVRPPRSPDGGNTVESKTFPGGHLGIIGANTPSKLRSRPRRVALFDEVDGYPASSGTEGDPVELGVKRTSTFWNRKIGLISTPTVKGHSRIENAFEESDQRRYLVPCPHCGHEQPLRWRNLEWDDDDPATAAYRCEECAALIEERSKPRMLERGRWEATAPDAPARGYHLNALYSPWFTWKELVREWLSAQGHTEKLRVFINTRLAETFEERGDAPEWQRLYDRREDYPLGTCPDGVEFLTAGADIQKDRLEVYVWGWGRDKESWLVDHVVLPGDPFDAATWAGMTELLGATYPAARGMELPLAAIAVDTGYAQETVADWGRRVGDRRVMLVKGDHWKNWRLIVGTPTRSEISARGKRHGLLLWPVGGALIKQETYGFLRLPTPLDDEPYPAGWVHLPMVDDEVVKQLVAEDLVTRTDRRGFAVREWVKNRDRNEALDCRVYARAAAERVGLARLVSEPEPDTRPKRPPAPKPAAPKNTPRRGGGGWLDNRKRGGWL